MHGQFVWYELTTPDTAAAQKFYPSFTGWGTQAFDENYTMWTSGGVPFAGLFKLSPEMRAQGVPPNWMPYIESGNVDDTARLATSLGGAIVVPPSDIPGTGRFAVLRDPQGATFGIYKSSRASQGWDGTPVLGRFSWHELMTTDYAAAYAFYQKLFGWEKTGEMDMGGGSMYFMYGKGQPFGGMFNRPPEMASMPPFWLCYIFVKDVPKAVETAAKRGATVVRPPMPIPGGVISVLSDPQGAGFAVHHADAVAAPSARPAKSAGSVRKKKTAKAASRPARAKAAKARKKATRPAKKAARKAGTGRRKAARKATAKKRPARRPARKAAGGRGRRKAASRRHR